MTINRTGQKAQTGRPTSGPSRGGPSYGLEDVLLPTPQAFDARFSEVGISDEAAERQLHRTDGYRRSTTGSLTKDLVMLKTPTAQLAVNGGSQHPDKRREGGHGPTLADQVEHQLLPTPRATDGTKGGPNQRGSSGDLMLPSAVMDLLPTPRASDTGTPGRRASEGFRPPLSQVLLPTPTARLGDSTSRGADPARYKGPQSLNGRRSNLDDCIAAVETQAPWLSRGEPTGWPSAAGNKSSDGQLPGQLSLDGPESD
jgi:hypothetical protein